MFGFVAALSSAVTVIILIIASSLLNLLSVHNQNELAMKNGLNYLNYIDNRVKYNDDNTQFTFGGNVLSNTDVNNILKYRKNENVYLTCSYGSNLSEDVSRRLLAFNFLRLKYNIDGNKTIIKIEPLKYNTFDINSCSVRFGK